LKLGLECILVSDFYCLHAESAILPYRNTLYSSQASTHDQPVGPGCSKQDSNLVGQFQSAASLCMTLPKQLGRESS
jgi:hypothetical protein